MKKTLTWIGCLAALALAAPAQAGGVIIDGWDDPSVCTGACSKRVNSEDEDETEQEIYLLAAFVFGGHAATEAEGSTDLGEEDINGNDTADDAKIVIEDPDIPNTIIDDLEGQDLGGCAAAPGGLAALAGLLLLRRRRR